MHSTCLTKAVCLSVLLCGGAFGGTISLQTSASSVPVGNSLSVTVKAVGFIDLYAFQFDVTFDPALLSAVTVTEGSLFSGVGVSFSPGSIDNGVGVITFIGDALSGSGPGINSDGPLAQITFNAIGPGLGIINLGSVILLDSALGDISANTVGVVVTTTGSSAVPEAASSSLVLLGIVSLAWLARKRL